MNFSKYFIFILTASNSEDPAALFQVTRGDLVPLTKTGV